jgi:drug/metabolite transporter (DMT)-like permease
MAGPLLALLSAITFALTAILVRRAVLKVTDARIVMVISVPAGLPFFIFILVLSGQMRTVLNFSWQGYFYLSLAGILFFVIGRFLMYSCVQLVGANIANILARVNILVSVIIGITFLHEPLSWQLVIGVLLICIGIILTGLNPPMLQNSNVQLLKIPARAFLLGIGCGIAVGIAPIFVKLGLKDSGYPLAGTFISLLAATVVLSIYLMRPGSRNPFIDIKGAAVILFCSIGILSCTAHLIQYMALNLAPASIVAPLVYTSPIFILFFSFLFNRKLETFNKPIIIGTVSVVIGSILLF